MESVAILDQKNFNSNLFEKSHNSNKDSPKKMTKEGKMNYLF